MPVALFSSHSKSPDVSQFARDLAALGFELLASSGTAEFLVASGIRTKDVAIYVGEPILEHRVVTLSREINAALLATDSADDVAELKRLGVPRIDLLYCDLYPLREAIKEPGATLQSVVEQTDIGGPTLIRSAAKGRRIVVVRPEEMPLVLAYLRPDLRRLKDRQERFISSLAHTAELVVANYCHVSSEFHRKVAEGRVPIK